MIAVILRRIAAVVPVLLFVAIFAFFLMRLVPGDPAVILAGNDATPQQIELIREQLGLNEPLPLQFLSWAGRALVGDFGRSFYFNRSVAELIWPRLEPTLALAVATSILSMLLAIPLGATAAAFRGSWIDRSVSAVSVVGFGVPGFVIGYVLVFIFAVKLQLLPVQGYSRIENGFGPFLRSITLPSIALALVYMALLARVTRTSVIEVLEDDYIKTARAKGASETVVLLRHALVNAANPIITSAGTGLSFLIGGTMTIETVFNIPGVGRLLIDSVLARDYAVVQTVLLLLSVGYVIINAIIDVTYLWFDPRISY